MSTILEKITEAAKAGESLKFKVNRQTVDLYSHTRNGNPYWTLVWYEGGKRQRKVTSDTDKLLKLAKVIIDATGDGIPASPTISEEPDTVTGVSIKELMDFYKSHHPTTRDTVSPTLRSVADEFISHTTKAGRSERHIRTLRHHLKAACKKLPDKIRAVSVYDIDGFLHGIPNLKTRKNHRITLVTLFKFAQRKGILDAGDTAADKSTKPKTLIPEPEIFTPEEMLTLLEASAGNPLVKAFLIFGGFCGLRSAEIQRLQWENVKGDHIVISASITKTARRRIAEIPENARGWIEAIRQESGPVSYSYDSAIYNVLRPMCAAAGVEWKQNALRHSFASYHLEFHRDPPRTSKTAGHSLQILETVYAKLVPREEAVSWFSLFPASTTNQENQKPHMKQYEQSTRSQQRKSHIQRAC